MVLNEIWVDIPYGKEGKFLPCITKHCADRIIEKRDTTHKVYPEDALGRITYGGFHHPELLFDLFCPDCLSYLVTQLAELGTGSPTLLEVKVRTTIDGFNNDFFTSPAGEEDERCIFEIHPDFF